MVNPARFNSPVGAETTAAEVDAFIKSILWRKMAMTSSMETLVVVNLKNREAIFEQFAVISLSFSSCGRNIFICKKDWEVTLMIRICRRIGLTVTARPDLWDDERYHIIIAKESDIMSLMQVNIRAFTGFYFYMIDNKKIDIRAIVSPLAWLYFCKICYCYFDNVNYRLLEEMK